MDWLSMERCNFVLWTLTVKALIRTDIDIALKIQKLRTLCRTGQDLPP